MKRLLEKSKGITLIALVVTIVVLLILAGVSISMLTGENGIITQAQKSKNKTEIGEEKDFVNLSVSAIKSDKIARGDTSGITKEELQKEINNYTDEANVTNKSEDTEILIVKYNSGRKYEVDGSGKVSEVEESYDGMYSVSGLEGKIVPDDLFIYEYDIGTSGNSTKIAATESTELPTKEARIVMLNPQYCNWGGYDSEIGEIYDDTNYEINYKGTIISDTLVIPYQVEYEGEMYTITEACLGTYWKGLYSERIGHMPKVKTIIYPNTVKTIFAYDGGNENYPNDQIENIILPNNLIEIGEYAFCSCNNLKNITIPKSVTSIGDYAFGTCTGLTSITIPSSVTSIGNYAFSYCENLTTVNYTGTEEQWNAITIGSRNDYLTNATINYNYIGQ